MDPSKLHNLALQAFVDELEVVYQSIEKITLTFVEDATEAVSTKSVPLISRADFWALAGMVATEESAKCNCASGGTCPTFDFNFKWGRQDNEMPAAPASARFAGAWASKYTESGGPFCNDPSSMMADADGGQSTLTKIFTNGFKMSTEQAVCMMGAHTLGATHFSRSTSSGGYYAPITTETVDAPWTSDSTCFNNDYFVEAGTGTWTSAGGIPEHFFKGSCQKDSVGSCRGMLKVDLALRDGANKQFLDKYAASNADFLFCFQGAYTYMVDYAHDNLQELDCEPNAAYTLPPTNPTMKRTLMPTPGCVPRECPPCEFAGTISSNECVPCVPIVCGTGMDPLFGGTSETAPPVAFDASSQHAPILGLTLAGAIALAL